MPSSARLSMEPCSLPWDFAGLINLVSALVCTIPVLVISVQPIAELAVGITSIAPSWITDTHAGRSPSR